MKKITLIIFIGLISSGVLFGCSPRRTVSIGEAENGKTVQVNAGDTLTISLAGNPSTGYNWYVASVNANILKQQGEAAFSASSSAIGAGPQKPSQTTKYVDSIVRREGLKTGAGPQKPSQNEGLKTGAGGTLTLTFQAALAGKTSLVLEYKRIWETGVAPAQTYSVIVVVQ